MTPFCDRCNTLLNEWNLAVSLLSKAVHRFAESSAMDHFPELLHKSDLAHVKAAAARTEFVVSPRRARLRLKFNLATRPTFSYMRSRSSAGCDTPLPDNYDCAV